MSVCNKRGKERKIKCLYFTKILGSRCSLLVTLRYYYRFYPVSHLGRGTGVGGRPQTNPTSYDRRPPLCLSAQPLPFFLPEITRQRREECGGSFAFSSLRVRSTAASGGLPSFLGAMHVPLSTDHHSEEGSHAAEILGEPASSSG